MDYKFNQSDNNDSSDNQFNTGFIFLGMISIFSLICLGHQIKLCINNNLRSRIEPSQLTGGQNSDSEIIIHTSSINNDDNENISVEINVNNSNPSQSNLINNTVQQIDNNQNKLDKEFITNSLKLYSNIIDSKGLSQDEECIICNDNLCESEVRIFSCLHKFHKKCIDDWLLTKKTLDCPICNQRIDEFEKLESYQKIIKLKD